MTSPNAERLSFIIDSLGAGQVVGDLQRIGSTGATSQTALQAEAKATEAALVSQGRAGGTAMSVIADGASRSTGMVSRLSERLGVSESTIRTGLATAAAVGFGALIAKAGEAVTAYIDLAGEVRDFQRVSGASAEESSKFVAVLDDLGVSAEAGSSAVAKLARVDPSKLAAFGVEVAKAADGTTDLTGTLLNVADAYAATSDPQQRALLGNAAFGRSYRDLIPLLEQGRSGLQQYFDGVNAGQIYTQEALDQARQYELALDNLQDSAAEFGQAFGRTVVPILTDILNIGAGVLGFFDNIPAPLVQAAIAGTAFALAGSKISSALSGIRDAKAGEALADAAGQVSGVGAAAEGAEGKTSRFGRAVGGLKSAAGAAGTVGALIPLVGALADALRSAVVEDRDVDSLAASIEHLAKSGEAVGSLGAAGGIDGLATSLKQVIGLKGETEGFMGIFTGAGANTTMFFSQSTEDVTAFDEALSSLVQGGNAGAAQDAFNQLAAAAAAQGISLDDLKAQFPEYAKALEDADLAQQNAAGSGEDLGGAVELVKGKVADAADQVDHFRQQIEKLTGGQISLAEADIAARDAVADFTTSVQEAVAAGEANALSLDRNTQAGRDNESALLDQIKAAQDLAAATLEQTGSTDQAAQAFQTQIGTIRDNMIALGFNRDMVNALIARYGAIPPGLTTNVNLNDGATGKLVDITGKMRNLDGTTATVYVKQVMTTVGNILADFGLGNHRAGGGAVERGTDYLVGETRPEVFRPAVAGTIVPTAGFAQNSGRSGEMLHVAGDLVLQDRTDIDYLLSGLAFEARR